MGWGPTHGSSEQAWEVGVVMPVVLQIWRQDRGKWFAGQSCREEMCSKAGRPEQKEEQAEVFPAGLQVVHRGRAAGQVSVLAQEESSRSHCDAESL